MSQSPHDDMRCHRTPKSDQITNDIQMLNGVSVPKILVYLMLDNATTFLIHQVKSAVISRLY